MSHTLATHNLNLPELRKQIDEYLFGIYGKEKMAYTIKEFFPIQEFPFIKEATEEIECVANIIFVSSSEGIYLALTKTGKICGHLLHNDIRGNLMYQMQGTQHQNLRNNSLESTIEYKSNKKFSVFRKLVNWFRFLSL